MLELKDVPIFLSGKVGVVFLSSSFQGSSWQVVLPDNDAERCSTEQSITLCADEPGAVTEHGTEGAGWQLEPSPSALYPWPAQYG